MLNYISPCDGRGGNIFSITLQRLLGTYRANPFGKFHFSLPTHVLDRIPFEYSFSNVSILSPHVITYSYEASHPSKVICVTSRADLNEEQVSLKETLQNRYYYHSDRPVCQEMDMRVVVGQDSRLYCHVVDLASENATTYFYRSTPFVIQCKHSSSLTL